MSLTTIKLQMKKNSQTLSLASNYCSKTLGSFHTSELAKRNHTKKPYEIQPCPPCQTHNMKYATTIMKPREKHLYTPQRWTSIRHGTNKNKSFPFIHAATQTRTSLWPGYPRARSSSFPWSTSLRLVLLLLQLLLSSINSSSLSLAPV